MLLAFASGRTGVAVSAAYSQEVYAAELELASLVRQTSTARPPGLLDAARRRLSLWEIPASVIAKVEATGEPQRTFPLLAPRAVQEVLDVVESSIGAMDVATTYEGRERYKINVRYPRELRDDIEKLRAVLVPIAPLSPRPLPTGGTASGGMDGAPAPMVTGAPSGGSSGGMGMGGGRSAGGGGPGMAGGMAGGDAMSAAPSPTGGLDATAAFVPLGQLATIETVMGPPMIKSELGSINGWVYVDIDSDDIGGYVDAAKAKVASEVKIPQGYSLKWTGQYELLERVRTRMSWILPLTLLIVFVILFVNFRGAAQSLIVMTGVPFAAVGAIWTLWLFGFNTSIAVWVGMIALLGVAAETASVMVVNLDEAWNKGEATVRSRLWPT